MSRPVAIVTGAGSGIGRCVARQLAEEGFALVLVGRTAAKLEETARGLGENPHLLVAADLAERAEPGRIVADCIDRFGRLDCLVQVAGIAPLAPLAETDDALLAACFEANAFGPARLIRAAWPHFARQRGGRVVNVSTIGTLDPFPGFFAYAASKSALDSFTRSAAREGAAIGVEAWSVNPGAVETPLLRQNFGEAVIPSHRTLSPEAVARVVVDCVMARRSEPSGSIIPMPSR